MENIVPASYFGSAIFFILGLKMLSSPATARRGNLLAGLGMILAILFTFCIPGMKHELLMILIIAVGTVIGWVSAKKVPLTDMPQMVALFDKAAARSAFKRFLANWSQADRGQPEFEEVRRLS